MQIGILGVRTAACLDVCWRWGRAEFRTMKEKLLNKSKTSTSQQVVKEAVSSKLRAYYDDISRQEVPQRFLDLLQDLDKANEPSE